MPIPPFVAALREKVGNDLLWLTTADAVILRGGQVLLVHHGERREWMLPGGGIEPGEHPADAAAREAFEETGVTVSPERLVAVTVSEPYTHGNGDRSQYLEFAFACRFLSGEARVNDSESTAVAWFPVTALPGVSARVRAVIGHAVDGTQDILAAAG